MKYHNLLSLFALAILAINASAAQTLETGSLTIEMRGIAADQGQAVFILMDSSASHRGDSPIYSKKLVAVNHGSAKVTFNTIPLGDYSAVIYHDLNGNGKLDRYFFGKPKEPYGFSNNARNPLGIPDFSEAQFAVSTNHHVQTITIK